MTEALSHREPVGAAPAGEPDTALPHRAPAEADPAAAVARLPERALRRLAPLPTTRTVTATHGELADPRAAGEQLARLGLTSLGRVDGRPGCVDVLLDPATQADEPGWCAQVAAAAERVYRVGHGPVRLLLGDVIDAHLGARTAG